MGINTQLLNKTILFTVLHYCENTNRETYNHSFIVKLRSAILGYLTFHKMSKEESQKVVDIGKGEFMVKLKEQHIDYAIYLLALMKLWVEKIPKEYRRNALNMSDKKILQAKSELVMDMLKLKSRDGEEYLRVKAIIDDSNLVAKQYFMYLEENL